ncbi:MAG: extracellular solute-binding protein, partial [Chloroflexi bacterium]
DLSNYHPKLLDFYNIDGAQVSIPYIFYPAVMFYNKTLFDASGIPYPPQNYGEPYIDWNGELREWNMDTLREVAMKLTLDKYGNDATMDAFDPWAIQQVGFSGWSISYMRYRDTLFGAGNLIDDNGRAIIPPHWREAEHWYHRARWEDFFLERSIGTVEHTFFNQNAAITIENMWFTTIIAREAVEFEWDFAPIPSYQGITTTPLHEDTFRIYEATQHPQEAFTVLTYLLSNLETGEPTVFLAHNTEQESSLDTYIAELSEQYPHIDWASLNWDVVFDALDYIAIPSQEAFLPNYGQATARISDYTELVDNTPDVDIDAELDRLQNDLQVIFDTTEN